MDYFIGVDIGGTKIAVVIGDENPSILKKNQINTNEFTTPENTLEYISTIISGLLRDCNLERDQIRAVGISCGGPLDISGGIILSPPNLPGWDSTPVVTLLKEATGFDVFLQNDANAGALAEWRWGAGKGCRNIAFLTFGTGLGAGLILDGKLYSGTNGMAGEIGHIRMTEFGPAGYGKMGTLEGYASGGGIAQVAKTAVLSKFQGGRKVGFCPSVEDIATITAEVVGLAAEAGDETALEILSISGHYLGRGLAVLVDILNLEKIILGSIYSRCRRFLEPALFAALADEAIPRSAEVCAVVPAALSDEIGDYASLAVAINAVSAQNAPGECI